MVSPWSSIPARQFIASVCMRPSLIVVLLGMAVLRSVSPHLHLGSIHGQREDHKIGGSYMGKILGISTSVTGITITNSIENFNQKFDMHTIYFKFKSLLLHCWDHSVKFADSPRWFCVWGLHWVIIAEPTIIYNTWLWDLAPINSWGNVYILVCMLIVAIVLLKVYAYCCSC